MAGEPERRVFTLSTAFTPYGQSGWRVGPLLRHALELTGAERPRVCVLATAQGDNAGDYLRVLGAFERTGVAATHLSLFPMPNVENPRDLLLDQDLIMVGGGSVANMLAVWRVHGLDAVMREAWERGILLSGASAGAICWFVGGTTDSFGPALRLFKEGLGLLPHSYCPHYNSEALRRPTYQRLVGDGSLPAGWGADDGVGMLFVNDELQDVVADRPDIAAWRVERDGDQARESHVAPRVVG
ncbi:MAG TPA: peptidase E [Candidatus Dormibacteraeota bacterium]|nr:peptidase E [Candidatus Dormibacteraeota bacterium]